MLADFKTTVYQRLQHNRKLCKQTERRQVSLMRLKLPPQKNEDGDFSTWAPGA